MKISVIFALDEHDLCFQQLTKSHQIQKLSAKNGLLGFVTHVQQNLCLILAFLLFLWMVSKRCHKIFATSVIVTQQQFKLTQKVETKHKFCVPCLKCNIWST